MGKKSRRNRDAHPTSTQSRAAASGAPLDLPSSLLDAALCPDGLPPLYPRPPRWPVDAEIKRKYAEKCHLPPFMVPGDRQQIPDMANRHFQHLAKINDDPNDIRPASEWAAVLCGPSCWDPVHLGTDATPCTAGEFQSRMTKEVFGELGFQFARPYEVPQNPIPTFCDNCNKECTSVCGRCGEIYCSRKCLKDDWNKHRRICDMVYENENLATLFSQLEMKEALTDEELQVAWGMKPEKFTDWGKCLNCNNAGAKMKCTLCGVATYCSKDCQRPHWPVHKLECKGMKGKKDSESEGNRKGSYRPFST